MDDIPITIPKQQLQRDIVFDPKLENLLLRLSANYAGGEKVIYSKLRSSSRASGSLTSTLIGPNKPNVCSYF